MKQKKPKKPKRKTATIRFDDAELSAIDADRKDITNGGIPVSRGAYCKHAVAKFAALRLLEKNVKQYFTNPARFLDARPMALELLQTSGLTVPS